MIGKNEWLNQCLFWLSLTSEPILVDKTGSVASFCFLWEGCGMMPNERPFSGSLGKENSADPKEKYEEEHVLRNALVRE